MGTKTEIAKNRIIWLHERMKGGSYPNAQREAERFEISETQAHRDIRLMREKLGAPLAFDRQRNGFYYTCDYSLPDFVRSSDTEDSVAAIASSEAAGGVDAQMMIPYTAVIEAENKLAVLELGRYIKRNAGKNRYFCEFKNPSLFIGMLLASGEKIRILEPEWLRIKLISACEGLAEVNKTE